MRSPWLFFTASWQYWLFSSAIGWGSGYVSGFGFLQNTFKLSSFPSSLFRVHKFYSVVCPLRVPNTRAHTKLLIWVSYRNELLSVFLRFGLSDLFLSVKGGGWVAQLLGPCFSMVFLFRLFVLYSQALFAKHRRIVLRYNRVIVADTLNINWATISILKAASSNFIQYGFSCVNRKWNACDIHETRCGMCSLVNFYKPHPQHIPWNLQQTFGW